MQKERLSFLTVCVAKNGGRPRKRKEERERERRRTRVTPVVHRSKFGGAALNMLVRSLVMWKHTYKKE